MAELRHSYDFDTLPHERHPRGVLSPAEKELRRLAQKATHYGPNGCPTNRTDVARREQEKMRQRGRWGDPTPGFTFNTRPGAFIEREKDEVRVRLRELTSDEAQYINHLDPPWVLHDFYANPDPAFMDRHIKEKKDPPKERRPLKPSVWTFSRKTRG